MPTSFNTNEKFPTTRLRRLRYNPAVRQLASEITVQSTDLILPLFVRSGKKERREIASMPGHCQLSVDLLEAELVAAAEANLGGVILFGIPEKKDATGSDALSDDGIIAQALREAKKKVPELLVMTDVCFCEYTDHGQCGIVGESTGRMDVENDATLEILAQQALVHAKAGADLLAPSGMIDGMIGAMRQALDANGFSHLPIMSYAAKYASAFYGPFRDAAESAPTFGDRRGYQMDPTTSPEQALREIALDLEEGADFVMVKPALAYLDILRLAKDHFPGVPLAAYCVSGEYSAVKAAAEKGWLDEEAVALEMLTSIKRAGAGTIITYWAKDLKLG